MRLLATRDDISILMARSSRGAPCFLLGRRGIIGLTVCGPTKYPFPSARLPDIDLSALAAKPGQHHPLISTLSGIAADDVARVAVHFVRGRDYVVRVVRNTYIDTHVPQQPAVMLVALDRYNRPLMRIPLPVPTAIVRAKVPGS